jgi:sulfatase modifying factor 1
MRGLIAALLFFLVGLWGCSSGLGLVVAADVIKVAVHADKKRQKRAEKRGTLGHRCYPDGTCSRELVCAYGTCESVWVYFKGGSLAIKGAENPGHRVVIAPFWLMRNEVTVDQYAECVRAGECSVPAAAGACNWEKPGRGIHPVNGVSHQEAKDFCARAGGRLPSEAEWEFAARSGGQNCSYPWGLEPATCKHAVMNDPAKEGKGCGFEGTRPVCGKPWGYTRQGLCDMAGNVFEWVEGTSNGSRNLRGGSWETGPAALRVSRRDWKDPGGRYCDVGFRCARLAPSSGGN